MHSWFFSLQFRLIAGFALVIALALLGVSSYIGLAARQEVQRIQDQSDRARANRVEQTLSDFYATNRGWSGIQSVIERAGFLSRQQIVVLDEDDNIVGDSSGHRGGMGAFAHRKSDFVPFMVEGRRVASVLIAPSDDPDPGPVLGPRRTFLPYPPESFQEPPLTQFAVAINRSLISAGLAAGAGGVLLVSLMSRRVLNSVRQLSTAAQQLGRGDLTQRVPDLGRDEIGRLGRTFNSMAEGLQDAERQRRNMTADVAHELRTPLSNIQGYVEAVRDGLLEPQGDALDAIHEQVVHLSHLVNDLKLLAETEAGDFYLACEPDSLEDVVRRSLEAFRPRAEAKGVGVSTSIPPDFPLVELDRTRIAQVIGNLLENALRHTAAGGRITVSAGVEETRARVTVADTGEGISPDALPYVFERFYRADPSRSRGTGGIGLGLTIARQLVVAHGGGIRVESAPGEGSRFIFDLPLESDRT